MGLKWQTAAQLCACDSLFVFLLLVSIESTKDMLRKPLFTLKRLMICLSGETGSPGHSARDATWRTSHGETRRSKGSFSEIVSLPGISLLSQLFFTLTLTSISWQCSSFKTSKNRNSFEFFIYVWSICVKTFWLCPHITSCAEEPLSAQTTIEMLNQFWTKSQSIWTKNGSNY